MEKDVTCDCGEDSEIAAYHCPILSTSPRFILEVPDGEAKECEFQSREHRSDSFGHEEGAEQHVCIEGRRHSQGRGGSGRWGESGGEASRRRPCRWALALEPGSIRHRMNVDKIIVRKLVARSMQESSFLLFITNFMQCRHTNQPVQSHRCVSCVHTESCV